MGNNVAWRAAHRQYLRDYDRRYRAEHGDELRRRARGHYRRMAENLRVLKLLRGCVDCGYDKNADALEFDHIEPKKSHLGRLLHSPKMLIEELAKCEVRCANCHAIITQARRRAAKTAAA